MIPHPTKRRLVNRKLLVGLFTLLLVLNCLGCDTALAPGQEIYALKNPTRSWKVPVVKQVDPQDAARLAVDSTSFDFGLVEPHVPATHELTLRNEGRTVLVLKRLNEDPSIQVSPNELLSIPPGKTVDLRLSWTPAAHTTKPLAVKFRTNDPQQPLFKFQISGEVASTISVDPPMLAAARVRPDRATEMSVLLSSQRWNHFELSNIASDLPGLTWKVEPAGSDRLQSAQAQSGWLLRVELPKGLPPGAITDKSLHVEVKPHQEDASVRQLEIPIHANVLRRVSVYGGGIDQQGTIHFGVLPAGKPHKQNLIVKVHDELPTLKVHDLHVTPDFLAARLKPYRQSADAENLYQLEVALPASAAPCVYRGHRLGKIRFEFDHPRISKLELNVDFILHGGARHALAN
ncbi:MAG: DUF1573 domain-containing protein [Pirellulales bacterium]|nr:DUF1573 domain-containing protein [Pirellulales bacterium]